MTTCPKCGWEIGEAKRCERCGFRADLWASNTSPRQPTGASRERRPEMTWAEAFHAALHIIWSLISLPIKFLSDRASSLRVSIKRQWRWPIFIAGMVAVLLIGSMIIGRNPNQSPESGRRSETKWDRAAALRQYSEFVGLLDEKRDFILQVTPGLREKEVKITVTNAWHIQHYQARLQLAQNLWTTWAKMASPREPDQARISIVDLNGNEVGGSRILGGSLIWVSEK
jgi:hypothetical protein